MKPQTVFETGICPNPLFIIGSPRSGTTGVAVALREHPKFWAAEESQILWDLFGDGRLSKNYRRQGQHGGSWLINHGVEEADFLGFVGLGLNALFTSQSEGKRWIDHTPMYTLMAEEIADLFPGCQFIHLLRDGRQAVESMVNYADAFRVDPDSVAQWQHDFAEACRFWRIYVEAGLALAENRSDRCLTIRYEELVRDPEPAFEAMFDFLGVEADPGPPSFFSRGPVNSSFDRESGRGGFGVGVADPWEKWTADQRRIFAEEDGELMTRLGYVTDELTSPSPS